MYSLPVGFYVVGLIVNVFLSFLIAEYLGSKRNIGFGWSLFFCLFFSPLLGLIITLLSRKKIA
jgi:hypothetical protein